MGYVRSGKHGYSTFHLNAFRLGYNEHFLFTGDSYQAS
ncbi:predicted protein [Sclerotinia sclerotiorum 1980 UF-70]|uniref:Uncharacterized protein n=1 Tax=Sclerotinia sclerotiorum (strain ATCC 18683 / 1980 / Ss-1) TaxID=665079 RepID=A7EIQ3_SCLS1|nr:predicted protein [Sclerotinia sclerotiorum 1980 UF-70]EDO02719.1 predicted protein [Sclerotinia sclerotiorum 1980 UF-70]